MRTHSMLVHSNGGTQQGEIICTTVEFTYVQNQGSLKSHYCLAERLTLQNKLV